MIRRWYKPMVALWITCAVFGYLSAVRAPVDLQLMPSIVRTGQAFEIRIHIIPTEADRWLMVEAEMGSSIWSLEGADARRSYVFTWRATVEPGEYPIAVGIGHGQTVRSRTDRLLVVIE